MKIYEKRGHWCYRTPEGRLMKFSSKKDAEDFTGKMFKSEYDESDEIEAEKTLAEKMKKAKTKRPKPAVVLDDLQGSYE